MRDSLVVAVVVIIYIIKKVRRHGDTRRHEDKTPVPTWRLQGLDEFSIDAQQSVSAGAHEADDMVVVVVDFVGRVGDSVVRR